MQASQIRQGYLYAIKSSKSNSLMTFADIVRAYGTNLVYCRVGKEFIAIICKSHIDDVIAVKLIEPIKRNNYMAYRAGKLSISEETYPAHKLTGNPYGRLYRLYEEV